MDEIASAAPGRSQDLKKEKKLPDQGAGILQAERGRQLEASGKSPSIKMPVTKTHPLAGPPVHMSDYELTFTPHEPIEGMKVLAPKLEALVQKVGGEYLLPTESSDALKRDLLLRSQTIWLTLPENRYSQFKTELASLGKIEESSFAPEIPAGSMALPKPSTEIPPPLRIKLILQLPEKIK